MTFNIESWDLYATCLFIRVNITTKYQDSTITYKLWPRQGINYKILTFYIVSQILYATWLHIRVNISTKYHEETTITCAVTAQTRYKLQNVDIWSLGMTLTFDIESLILYSTLLHIRVNISIKYHEDTTIVCEVMACPRYKL